VLQRAECVSPSPQAGRRKVCMSPVVRMVLLLVVSNLFMTFAWYGHLKNLAHKPWIVAVFASWSIALVEYLFQVPANRIGYTALTLSQLKIIQEVIALTVFVPFAMLYMRQPWSWNYLWAVVCILAAVFFIFREQGAAAVSPPPAGMPVAGGIVESLPE